MNDYYLELIRQKPINYSGLIFYPIEFGYICDHIGLDIFDKMLLPFLITKDCLTIDSDSLDNINLFEDVILENDNLLFYIALTLQLFCKCEDIYKSGKSIVLANKTDDSTFEFQVNAGNYDDICTIMRLLNGKNKIQVDKPPKNMSDRQRDVWEKLQAGRKKESDQNTVHIYDVLNICEFGGNYRISQDEIEKWTLWKIINCYKARLNLKVYDDSLKICLVSGDGKTISGNNHWHHKLQIHE